MIDPKLNEIVPKTKGGAGEQTDTAIADSAATTGAKPRPGLSINDTIAGDANLSVGSRGTDVSGVRAGSGAGAGGVQVTPGNSGQSPAPNLVPGARGTGTTPLGDTIKSNRDLASEVRGGSDDDSLRSTSNASSSNWTQEDVASRAYENWHARGCPHGSSDEDWHSAERELREKHESGKANTAKA